METKKCQGKAETVIPWGGKIMKGCRKHAHAMNVLASITGNPIEIRTLPVNDDPCEFNDDLE